MRSWLYACVAFAAVIAAAPAAARDDIAAPTGVCQIGYWTSNRNLDDASDLGVANCSLTWRQSLGESARVVLGGRAGYGISGAGDEWVGRLREAYFDWQAGPWSLRVGRQVLAWGRADRINPTDNLAPRDFTLLVAEDEEQKLGIDAARLRYELSSSLSASAIVAKFTPHKTPTGSWPANLVQATEPSRAEWAVKIDRTGEWDWSLSYLDGYERLPRYAAVFTSPTAFVFQGAFERARVIGFDAATALGAWTVRTEMAYTELRPECGGCTPYRRKLARGVVGADRDFLETSNINVQVFALRRSGYVDPEDVPVPRRTIAMGLDRLNSEFGREEWGVTLRLAHRAFNDRLKLDLSAIVDLTNRSGVLRPRMTFAYSDQIRLGAGVDHFRGKTQSFFGARQANQTAFADLSVVF